MARGNKWTEREVEILRNFYPTSDKNEIIEKIPKHTYNSIKYKAEELGIKKDIWWTEEELNILNENYENNYNNIGYLLPKRTHLSIKKKAFQLNLKIKEDDMFDIRNSNLKGRLDCEIFDNPNFNNDKELRYACRNKILTWRKNILDLFENKCAISGEEKDLVVHHIKPFNKIYHEVLCEFKNKGFIVNQDLIKCSEINGKQMVKDFISNVSENHKIEHGILISKDIHDDFHSKYGTRDFTENDFFEYVLKYHNIDLKEKINMKGMNMNGK